MKLNLGQNVAMLLGSAFVIFCPTNAEAADIAAISEKTCMVSPNQAGLDYQNRLFGFILAEAGYDPTPDAGQPLYGWRKQIIAAAYDQNENSAATDQQKTVVSLVKETQRYLSSGKSLPLYINGNSSGLSQLGRWLIDQKIELACKAETPVDETESPLRIRKDPASLKLTGDERLEAGAASASFKRERTILADGSTKRDTTFSLKGVVGYAITETDNHSAFAYAGYEINRVRSNPAPVLTLPATERDSDTELLKLGFFGHTAFGDKLNWVTSVDAAYLFDIAKRSERLRTSVAIVPALPFDNLGVCGVGALNSSRRTLIPGVQGKCTFTGLFEASHIFKNGSATFGVNDEFVQMGGKANIDLLLSGNFKAGFFAGAEYRYLNTIHGQAPAIDRFTGFLKYRHWNNNVGFDVGFEFIDGVNPDSFVDENILQLSFGIIL